MRTISISEQIQGILSNQVRINGNLLTLVGQLDRTTYMAVNRVLEELGGKWNKQAKAHLFSSDPSAIIAAALSDGSVEKKITNKQRFQVFETPPKIASHLVQLAEIENHEVLEPSAGNGALLREILIVSRPASVTAVEIQPEVAAGLTMKFKEVTVHCGDFLLFNGELGQFDRIVMNPPFTKGQDIVHIQHALTHLAPGGRLVAICGNGPKQQTALRSLSTEWIALGHGAFKSAGTNVSAAIVVIEP